jgi:hypothetical protein
MELLAWAHFYFLVGNFQNYSLGRYYFAFKYILMRKLGETGTKDVFRLFRPIKTSAK